MPDEEMVKRVKELILQYPSLEMLAAALYNSEKKNDLLRDILESKLELIGNLRTLVADMYVCIDRLTGSCDEMPCSGCPRDNDTGSCDYDSRLLEVGMKVVDE